jgi:site-specific DNA recombinase
MSNSQSTEAVRVAIYARRSTKSQEDSLERQLDSVRTYVAMKQYVVVGKPYVDDGICGDEFTKRPAFLRLLADAEKGLFNVVVADEWSRLSRQKPLDFFATVASPLDKAGVVLDTVADGVTSWDDLGKLILATVKADKSSGESITKSHRVAGEFLKMMHENRIVGGPVPYGLTTVRVPHPKKPNRTIPVRYEPDERTAHVVRWIFSTYAAGTMTLQQMADELTARRTPVPAPAQQKPGRPPCWSRPAIRLILKNPKYAGNYVANRHSNCKYHRIGKTAVAKIKAKDRRDKPREEWIVVPGVYTALVDQETFDLCQERLQANRGGRRSARDGVYLFSKMLVCGRCGRTLCAKRHHGNAVYRCSRRSQRGETLCAYFAAREDVLLDKVLEVLQRELLSPSKLEQLRRRARERDEAERSPAARDGLRERLAELEKKIARGNKNLAVIPEDLIPGVVEHIRAWEAERRAVKDNLQRQGSDDGHAERLEAVIRQREAVLWQLREAAKEADPLVLRRVLGAFIDRISVQWDTVGGRHRLLGGTIHFRTPGQLVNDRSPSFQGR